MPIEAAGGMRAALANPETSIALASGCSWEDLDQYVDYKSSDCFGGRLD